MLSQAAQRLVREAIKSVWALELLLLLRKLGTQPMTADQLARELRANPALVGDILAKFLEHSLIIESHGAFHYRPTTNEIDQLVIEIETAYAQTPIALIKQIADAPNEKIRAFADAFKLKRD